MKAAPKKSEGMSPKKSSAVIRPGTGSGFGVKAGSTNTPTSSPTDKQGLHRKPSGALK